MLVRGQEPVGCRGRADLVRAALRFTIHARLRALKTSTYGCSRRWHTLTVRSGEPQPVHGAEPWEQTVPTPLGWGRHYSGVHRSTRTSTMQRLLTRRRTVPRLADAKTIIEAWRVDYNTVRPHSSLAGRTPEQLAALSVGLTRHGSLAPTRGSIQRTSPHYPCSGFWGHVNEANEYSADSFGPPRRRPG
jgi:transposase InsO family protein